MTIKLICIDLDGTLLREDKTYDRALFDYYYRRLYQQGVRLAITTGNSYSKMIDYFDLRGLPDLYFACDNGNYLVKEDQVIHQHGLKLVDSLPLLDWLQAREGLVAHLSVGSQAYFTQPSGPHYDQVRLYNNKVTIVKDFSQVDPRALVSKIALESAYSLEETQAIGQEVMAVFPQVQAVTSGGGWMDVYLKGGGKGRAVAYFQDSYGIQGEESVAIGDSQNDLPMFEKVTFAVAMANGDPAVLAQAGYQLPSNEDQGVLQLLADLAAEPLSSSLEAYKKEG